MKPVLRKLLLTIHLTASLGWLGAAAAVLALGLAGLSSATGAAHIYQSTEVIWRSVIVPFSLAALVTGTLQALRTQWGLFRHYWVLAKFAITAAAVLLLVLHTNSLLPELAHPAIDGSAIVLDGHAHGHGGIPPRVHLVVAALGTVVLLLMCTTLSVYKPWGKIGRGYHPSNQA